MWVKKNSKTLGFNEFGQHLNNIYKYFVSIQSLMNNIPQQLYQQNSNTPHLARTGNIK